MYKNIFSKIFSIFFSCAIIFFMLTPGNLSAQVRGNVSSPIPSNKKLFSEVSAQCSPVGVSGLLTYKCQDGRFFNCANSARNSNMCDETSELEARGESGSCNPFRGFSVLGCFVSIISAIGGWILDKINWLLSWLVLAASWVFDFTAYTTIVKFKQNFANLDLNVTGNVIQSANLGALAGAGRAGLVDYLWGIIRDLLNVFIFLLVIYSAVQSMFEGFENTKKKFIWLLVFSIVVNFSLLFVKLAIDVSNILALQAYTLAVKPSGTNDFIQFRTPANGWESKSYGEYIMNSIDFNKLISKKTGLSVSEKSLVDGVQSTLMFQIGRFIVYIGILYILLFMSGILIARAVNFLLSMILAPLIAADIFFGTIGKNAGAETQVLVGKIRKLTEKIKKDFYEALVKGPLLIFIVFLIGVFADSIVGAGIMNEITRSAGNLPEMKRLDDTFTVSMFVFLKFAIFFALCQLLFSKLNEISSFGGSGMISGWGTRFANFTLGKGMSTLGWAGRNTVGRATNKLGLNTTFSRMAVNATKELENKDIGFFSRNFQQAKLSLAQRGLKTNKSLVEGSYDLRTPLSKGGLGKLISGATSLDASKDFGKVETRGYEKIQEEKAAERKKKEDERTKEIAGYIKATEAEVMAKKAKVGGQEITLEQMKELLKNGKESGVEDGDNIKFSLKGGDVSFKKDAVSDLFKAESPNGIDAIYHKEKEAAEKKISDENKKKFEKSRLAQMAAGNTRTVGDYLSVDRVIAKQGMEEKAQEEYLTHERKSAKEKAEKAKLQKNYIDGSLSQMTDNIYEQITKVEKFFPGVISPDDKNLKILSDFLSEAENLNLKNDENKKKLEMFNKDGKDTLFKAKEELLTKLRTHLNSHTTPANRVQLKGLKKQINEAIEKNKKNKENYEGTLTDKKGEKAKDAKAPEKSGGAAPAAGH